MPEPAGAFQSEGARFLSALRKNKPELRLCAIMLCFKLKNA
jgi:hypothetical protein